MAEVDKLANGPHELDAVDDTIYETNEKGKMKSVEEADTCRICRGEGSTDEPLFYPCKCSGSIKFVHQSCLIEWLSHSQKKHCELCKTSFRFTKLYDSHMPSTVPLPVFLRQAMVHIFKSCLTWARWHLVVFVWLGWVPWCMRTVWRGLFWVGDGGWINWPEMERQSLLGAQQQQLTDPAPQGSITTDLGSLQATDLLSLDTITKASGILPFLATPVSATLNLTSGEPTLFRVVKRLLQGIVHYDPASTTPQNSTVNNATINGRLSQRSPSWLSELTLLRSLTPWKLVNNVIIDVLEGQLITLFVCVAFILIFLIREWVVQQHPGINMVAAINVVERQPEQLPGQPEILREQPEQQNADAEPQDIGGNENPESLNTAGDTMLEAMSGPIREGSEIVDSQQNDEKVNTFLQDQPLSVGANANDSIFGPSDDEDLTSIDTSFEPGPSSSTSRPGLPMRDALARASEIQRTLEEQPGASDRNWPGLEVFMELWKRAGNNPTEVLRIIQEEDRAEELSWVVSAMKRLENATTDKHSSSADLHIQDVTVDREENHSGEQRSDASNESWQVVGGTDNGSKTRTPNSFLEQMTHKENKDYDADSMYGNKSTSFASPESLAIQPEGLHTQDSLIEIETSDTQKGKKSEDFSLQGHPDDHHTADEHPEDQLSTNMRSSNDLDYPSLTSRQTSENDTHGAEEGLGSVQFQDAEHEHQQNPQNPPTAINVAPDFSENLMDWLWGGVSQAAPQPEEQGEDDEHVVDNIANEAPFVPVGLGQLAIGNENVAENPAQDPEVLRAAVEAGLNPNDPEVIEEGEDLEGIMELIGMQGPLAGLVQNGMFSAVLISLTVFFGIWVPYIMGKLVLVLLANPVSLLIKLPLRWMSTIADIFIDSCIFVAACAFYWVDTIVHLSCTPIGWFVPTIAQMNENKFLATFARSYAHSALGRLAKLFVASGDSLSDSDIPVFSIVAHESLHTIKQQLASTTNHIIDKVESLCNIFSVEELTFTLVCKKISDPMITAVEKVMLSITVQIQTLVKLIPSLFKINPLRISLDIPQRTLPLDYSLAQWNTKDRVLAILLGYLSVSVAGAVYLKVKAAFREKREGEKPEDTITNVLYQAGGVMKVILIISIEMIVFPLYCGWLLDAALLPLFENATAMSRLRFTLNSPATSLFVHWFVGTCYMFHFALFVAMCRRIMRRGVLCKYCKPMEAYC